MDNYENELNKIFSSVPTNEWLNNAYLNRKEIEEKKKAEEKEKIQEAIAKNYKTQMIKCSKDIANKLNAYFRHPSQEVEGITIFLNYIRISLIYDCCPYDHITKMDDWKKIKGYINAKEIGTVIAKRLNEKGITASVENNFYSNDKNTQVEFFIDIYFKDN